jgi:RHS repeat-associated protein
MELSNHLGNVLVTISDIRTAICNESEETKSYEAVVVIATNSYAFGSIMPGREYTAQSVAGYRFGFNGKEKDDEINVDGGSYDFGARIYDGRLGRWLTVDPFANKNPSFSPYHYFINNPITFVDPDGKDAVITINAKDNTIVISTTIYLKGGVSANSETAETMQTNMMNAWNIGSKFTDKDGNIFEVKFDIKVKVKERREKIHRGDNIILTENDVRRSWTTTRSGVWEGGKGGFDLGVEDDDSPHEFGHLVNLADKYIEGVFKPISPE